MANTTAQALRRLWLNVHLWLGIGLAVLLIPISVSGGLLVYHDDIDAWFNPHRFAVSGAQASLPTSQYLASATQALDAYPGRPRAFAIRWPEEHGAPLRVTARAPAAEPGARPRIITVLLDPPTAKVLDVMDFRASLFGFLHVFHENLTLPQYSGRQIVGWAGAGMLVMSLTGLWLWWPRGSLLRGLRWSRSTRFTYNLHHLIGFWIALPLAAVSLTGIYLAFPQTARSTMTAIAPMTAQGLRVLPGEVLQQSALGPDRALELAAAKVPELKPFALFLPVAPRGGNGDPLWRVQLRRADGLASIVTIGDRDGAVTLAEPPKSGDQAAAWIRWIHEGSHTGPVWQAIVFLTGVAPTVFAVTGVIMWLRRRAARRNAERGPAAQLRPAE